LIADTDQQIEEARVRLARIGMETLNGYLAGGVRAWKEAGLPGAQTQQITPEELQSQLRDSAVQVLDVRRQAEWDAGHIEGATWWPLDNFKVSPPEIDRSSPIVVHCKSGYRSMIAASLLERAGFHSILNVAGGFDAWQQAKLPVVAAIIA
jgi:rhodanese-related sulfurtransferase